MDILRGLLGIAFLIGMGYLFSSNRKAIDWKLVGTGIVIQIILGLLILRVPFINGIFDYLASFFRNVLNYTCLLYTSPSPRD